MDKMLKKVFNKKNNNKYLFLLLIFVFALFSHKLFFTHNKSEVVYNRNKEMHWGFPMSRPPAPRMRNF